jgi:hypothetical protein
VIAGRAVGARAVLLSDHHHAPDGGREGKLAIRSRPSRRVTSSWTTMPRALLLRGP